MNDKKTILNAVPALVVFFCALPVYAADKTISVAEPLFVYLRADHLEKGADVWSNEADAGRGYDFSKTGEPLLATVEGAAAVQFNAGRSLDAWQCVKSPQKGLVEPNASRSIEVWVYNRSVPEVETILSWGRRGGPAGSSMSLHYGTNHSLGAVSHWDVQRMGLGWGDHVPEKGVWHHLVYTFDGTTARLYCDGKESNEKYFASAVIDTHDAPPVTLGAAVDSEGALHYDLRGTLFIGRVRIHGGVLSLEDIRNNYSIERTEFPLRSTAPLFLNAPDMDFFSESPDGASVYVRKLVLKGYPGPLNVQVVQPADAAITREADGSFLFSYQVAPGTGSFPVELEAENGAGETATSRWFVFPRRDFLSAGIQTAGELFVNLDAESITAGEPFWLNHGTLCDFARAGDPSAVVIDNVKAVQFNQSGTLDAYVCMEDAPGGLTGKDNTRSVEVWVYNGEREAEETMVAWGCQGGPAGSNTAFNFGSSASWGAVDHWGPGDLSWRNSKALKAGRWHYLAYTFDGETVRVYVDGLLNNRKFLGTGEVATHTGTPVAVGAQFVNEKKHLHAGVMGGLSIARVRVHDGVLTAEQVRSNFEEEKGGFALKPLDTFLSCSFSSGERFIQGAEHYVTDIFFSGIPVPELKIIEPDRAVVTPDGFFSYKIPDPEPRWIPVDIKAVNADNDYEISWTVSRIEEQSLSARPVHRYTFDGHVDDTERDANGAVVGEDDAYVYEDGALVLLNDGTVRSGDPSDGAYVDLPDGLFSSLQEEGTLEFWVSWNGDSPSQRIFDFGTSTGGEDVSSDMPEGSDYLFLTPLSSAHTLRLTYNSGTENGVLNEKNLEGRFIRGDGVQHYIVITWAVSWDGAQVDLQLYLEGRLIAEGAVPADSFRQIHDNNNWLGRSQWAFDSLYSGSYDEFRIYDYVLPDKQVAGNYIHGPDVVNIDEDAFVFVHTGDANGDDTVNIGDAICILCYRFGGGDALPCMLNGDVNDDASVNVKDAIIILSYLFTGFDFVAPDGTRIIPGDDRCIMYPKEEGVLECRDHCTL